MNGFQTLGEVLGHAASGSDGARQRGYLDAARGDLLMTKARQARDQAIAANQVHSKLVAAGIPEPQADLLSTIFAAKYGNFGDVSGYLKGNQLRDIRAQALDAAGRGDLNRENPLLGVLSGRPMVLSRVAGNVTLDPSQTPEGQSFTPTNIGEAMIGKYDRAPASKFTFTAPTNAEVLAVLGGHNNGQFLPPTVDPVKYRAFLLWRQQKAEHDPRFRDGDFAIAQYASVVANQNRDAAAYQKSLTAAPVAAPDVAASDSGFHPIDSLMHLFGAGSHPQPAAPSTPRVGTVQDGYRFKGGNPADPKNWQRVQ